MAAGAPGAGTVRCHVCGGRVVPALPGRRLPPLASRRLREGSRALLRQRLPGPTALFTFTWPVLQVTPTLLPWVRPGRGELALDAVSSLDRSAMRWVFMVLFGDFFLSLAFTVSCAAKGVF